ncbi:transcription factor MYB124-like [Arachis duranensis]|uniref:Transcription factor MYB124-like n=1 Tax=Arachis duranensis TaxID=130453 RepID=A0A9C6WBQ3_ARADU|nr:transcription factor MYB124-like [Arachis duranensis]
MVEDLSSNEGGQPCWRQMDLYEDSPASSEYSTGSTILPFSAGDIMEHSSHRDIETEMKNIPFRTLPYSKKASANFSFVVENAKPAPRFSFSSSHGQQQNKRI